MSAQIMYQNIYDGIEAFGLMPQVIYHNVYDNNI